MSRPLPGDLDYCDDCNGICDYCHSATRPNKTKEQRDEEQIQLFIKTLQSYNEYIQREVVKRIQEELNKNKN